MTATRQPQITRSKTTDKKKTDTRPEWLKVKLTVNDCMVNLKRLVAEENLNTVCQSAACPNMGDCWSRGTATFMILGNICTRTCGFCGVDTGRPKPVDNAEPARLAESLKKLGLRYAVITGVDRDDLADGGAHAWAETIRQVKLLCPDMTLEVLVGDFKGDENAVQTVVAAGPDIIGHNVETVSRLQKQVRPQASYQRSLAVLRHMHGLGGRTKSGIMVGLGETDDEVVQTLRDLRENDVELVSIGQYMRPTRQHLPVQRWVRPSQFETFRIEAERLGFQGVASAPLVRSSYRADDLASGGRSM